MGIFRRSNWGMRLPAIWLIISGAYGLLPNLSFPMMGTILAVLALAAGILILLER